MRVLPLIPGKSWRLHVSLGGVRSNTRDLGPEFDGISTEQSNQGDEGITFQL